MFQKSKVANAGGAELRGKRDRDKVPGGRLDYVRPVGHCKNDFRDSLCMYEHT